MSDDTKKDLAFANEMVVLALEGCILNARFMIQYTDANPELKTQLIAYRERLESRIGEFK